MKGRFLLAALLAGCQASPPAAPLLAPQVLRDLAALDLVTDYTAYLQVGGNGSGPPAFESAPVAFNPALGIELSFTDVPTGNHFFTVHIRGTVSGTVDVPILDYETQAVVSEGTNNTFVEQGSWRVPNEVTTDWDIDHDGVGNFSELVSGLDPTSVFTPVPLDGAGEIRGLVSSKDYRVLVVHEDEAYWAGDLLRSKAWEVDDAVQVNPMVPGHTGSRTGNISCGGGVQFRTATLAGVGEPYALIGGDFGCIFSVWMTNVDDGFDVKSMRTYGTAVGDPYTTNAGSIAAGGGGLLLIDEAGTMRRSQGVLDISTAGDNVQLYQDDAAGVLERVLMLDNGLAVIFSTFNDLSVAVSTGGKCETIALSADPGPVVTAAAKIQNVGGSEHSLVVAYDVVGQRRIRRYDVTTSGLLGGACPGTVDIDAGAENLAPGSSEVTALAVGRSELYLPSGSGESDVVFLGNADGDVYYRPLDAGDADAWTLIDTLDSAIVSLATLQPSNNPGPNAMRTLLVATATGLYRAP